MSSPATDGFEPLPGLAPVIFFALKAHPEWERDDQDRAVCAGDDCDWVKPSGGSTKKRFLNHQAFEVHLAVANWYDAEEIAA
jgi:hypothetical protein